MIAVRAQGTAGPWMPFEDRRRARDEKREAVLKMAVRMFLEDGYHRTSLADVAARLNITKPALYNYFRSKDDILSECYRMGQAMYEESVDKITRDGGPGLVRLKSLVRAYALVITQDFGRCVVRLDDRELPSAVWEEVRAAKRRIDFAFRETIKAGMADGSIKRCSARMASQVITGALNGIGVWFDPNGPSSASEIAAEFEELLTAGLAPPPVPT